MLSKDSHSVNAMEAADEERGEEEGMFLFFLYQTLLLCVFLLTDVFSFFFFLVLSGAPCIDGRQKPQLHRSQHIARIHDS